MKHVKNIEELIEEYYNDPLGLLKALDAFYECPKDANGKRSGPLVAYAGKYKNKEGTELNYVGDVYVNFSIAEQYPELVWHFANKLKDSHDMKTVIDHVDIVAGPQMGGLSLANMFALATGKRLAYVEKQVIKVKTAHQKEEANLAFLRHTIKAGESVMIMEDVLNNFSTTKETIDLIEKAGGTVVAIGGFLNRSLTIEHAYQHNHQNIIPVVTLVRKKIMEWRQSHNNVAKDVRNKNIVWKPKNEWGRLAEAMVM